MAVLTVATQKGGAGKTLICQVLASMLAADMRVVAIDADPTGALSRWASRAYEGPPFETVAEADETRLAHLIAARPIGSTWSSSTQRGLGTARQPSP
jgi:chromosome partitioning protein